MLTFQVKSFELSLGFGCSVASLNAVSVGCSVLSEQLVVPAGLEVWVLIIMRGFFGSVGRLTAYG